MDLEKVIYVAGHNGLVGSALRKRLYEIGYSKVIYRTRQELDLTNKTHVKEFFRDTQPTYVFLAAAKVGGIGINSKRPASFIKENLEISVNVISESYLAGVKRLLFFGSSCIYPRECAQPIKEEYLLTGPLEATNAPYAIAKIAGIEMCKGYRREYSCDFRAVMPTNLYGPGDRYDEESSHVIPAVIHKLHKAKMANIPSVKLWGTGRPLREFLYSEDLANAAIAVMNLSRSAYDSLAGESGFLNVGCGQDILICDLVNLIKGVVGYEGIIEWDDSQPSGTPRKLLDVSKIYQTGWRPSVDLREGLQLAYSDYLGRYGVATKEEIA